VSQKEPLQGGQLLVAVSGAVVTLFREVVGKGPERCKAYWAGDDLLVILLRGGYSVVEQVLFREGRGSAVQQLRKALDETLADPMVATIEELTGRKVIAFMSASHQEPDLTAELFVLEPQDGALPASRSG
jgi:uncharacterized protein YbcI